MAAPAMIGRRVCRVSVFRASVRPHAAERIERPMRPPSPSFAAGQRSDRSVLSLGLKYKPPAVPSNMSAQDAPGPPPADKSLPVNFTRGPGGHPCRHRPMTFRRKHACTAVAESVAVVKDMRAREAVAHHDDAPAFGKFRRQIACLDLLLDAR